MFTAKDLDYRSVQTLELGMPKELPEVPSDVFQRRVTRLLEAMDKRQLDVTVIYADREHYGNFKFFTGFAPRFEEAVLFIHKDGSAFCALGNECLSLAGVSKIPLTGVLCQCFSLPNQPMDEFVSIEHTIAQCAVKAGMKVGAVDWKLMHEKHSSDFKSMSGMPAYIVDGLANVVGSRNLVVNATDMMIKAPDGLRCCAEADAIAEFEFGATCASQSTLDMLDNLRIGVSELELAGHCQSFGLPLSCHSYIVAGENTRKGLIPPSNYRVKLGDELVVSMGMEGGLTCRHVYVAKDGSDLKVNAEEYMEEVVKPYMATVFNWYETMGLGVRCGDIYDMVETQIPKAKHGWTLNPGHMVGYEEWMCSPFFAGSDAEIRSGMMFQMDIIPSSDVYSAPNAEDGVAIADEALREQLKELYPEVYARIMARRAFAEEQIGLKLKPELLPLANSFANFNPYALNKGWAIVAKK